jgi:hypothetical protein
LYCGEAAASQPVPGRVSFAVALTSFFTVAFAARHKWVDRLLASTPKSVRLLLRTDAE